MQQRLRAAVVGGGIGKLHAEAYAQLADRFELLAVCDLDTARAQTLARNLGIPRVAGSLAELCAIDDLDLIDLCTPPNLHFEQIKQVLAAGKHAACEKPLVGSLHEADELQAAEARSGRRVLPIFQYRFGHGLQKLKYLADQGLTGHAYLATVEVAWRRRAEYYAVPWRGKWRSELGGAVLSHAIHALDMLLYVLGPARSVYARTATRVNPIETEDCAAATIELAGGALATLAVTLGSPVEISRHRFCFSNLVAESNTRAYTSSGDPWEFTGDTPELSAQIERALAGFVPLPEGFAGQFYRIHEALARGGEPPVTLADARAAIELISAIYASARGGQAVVLPLAPAHPLYGGWLPDVSLG